MQIDTSSMSTQFSSTATLSSSLTSAQKTAESDTSANEAAATTLTASETSTSTSSKLTSEEEEYDLDGDGVLSVTEEAAYMKAVAERQTLEAAASAQKVNQTTQRMQYESSFKQNEILGSLTGIDE